MKKKRINVTSKWSYLCFIPTVIGILKIIFYDLGLSDGMLLLPKKL